MINYISPMHQSQSTHDEEQTHTRLHLHPPHFLSPIPPHQPGSPRTPTTISSLRSTTLLTKGTETIIFGSGISAVFAARQVLHLKAAFKNQPNVLVLEARDICSSVTGGNGGHLQLIVHEQARRLDILDFELANFRHIEDLIEAKSIDCDFGLQGVMGFWSQKS
jgi:hypothetical protein